MSTTVRAPIGRDEELGAIARLLDDPAQLPATVVLWGEAGIGKTSLWLAGLEAAAERGYRTLSSRPSEAETRFSYAGLADLLGCRGRRRPAGAAADPAARARGSPAPRRVGGPRRRARRRRGLPPGAAAARRGRPGLPRRRRRPVARRRRRSRRFSFALARLGDRPGRGARWRSAATCRRGCAAPFPEPGLRTVEVDGLSVGAMQRAAPRPARRDVPAADADQALGDLGRQPVLRARARRRAPAARRHARSGRGAPDPVRPRRAPARAPRRPRPRRRSRSRASSRRSPSRPSHLVEAALGRPCRGRAGRGARRADPRAGRGAPPLHPSAARLRGRRTPDARAPTVAARAARGDRPDRRGTGSPPRARDGRAGPRDRRDPRGGARSAHAPRRAGDRRRARRAGAPAHARRETSTDARRRAVPRRRQAPRRRRHRPRDRLLARRAGDGRAGRRAGRGPRPARRRAVQRRATRGGGLYARGARRGGRETTRLEATIHLRLADADALGRRASSAASPTPSWPSGPPRGPTTSRSDAARSRSTADWHFRAGRGIPRAEMEEALALERSLPGGRSSDGPTECLCHQLVWSVDLDAARRLLLELRECAGRRTMPGARRGRSGTWASSSGGRGTGTRPSGTRPSSLELGRSSADVLAARRVPGRRSSPPTGAGSTTRAPGRTARSPGPRPRGSRSSSRATAGCSASSSSRSATRRRRSPHLRRSYEIRNALHARAGAAPRARRPARGADRRRRARRGRARSSRPGRRAPPRSTGPGRSRSSPAAGPRCSRRAAISRRLRELRARARRARAQHAIRSTTRGRCSRSAARSGARRSAAPPARRSRTRSPASSGSARRSGPSRPEPSSRASAGARPRAAS